MIHINFKANFIKPVMVKPKDEKSYKTSMVELNCSDSKDMETLRDVACMWGTDTYAYDIYSNVMDDYSPITCDSHIYALTHQKTDFDELNSDDILCLAQFSNGEVNELDCLQVNSSKKYNNIGSSMLYAIKTLHSDPIYIHSDPLVSNFYKKNSCVQSKQSDLDFYVNV